MSTITIKSFNNADEVKEMDKVVVNVCKLGETVAAKLTAQPGWGWSKCVKPLVGGDSCQASHLGFLEQGTMFVKMDDGTEQTIEAGMCYHIGPGHDGWVVGDEPIVGYEFNTTTAQNYGSSNEENKEENKSTITCKSFNNADETKEMDHVTVNVCKLGDTVVSQMMAQPGWSWSKCIKPLVGGDSCQASHLGFCQEGTMVVKMDDGTEQTIEPGMCYHIGPGHDGWVVGDKPVVGLEFNTTTAQKYGSSNDAEEKKEA